MNALINMHKFCGMCVLVHKYINFSKYTICIMYNNWKLHTDNEINAFIDKLLDIDFTTLTLMLMKSIKNVSLRSKCNKVRLNKIRILHWT